MGWLAFLATVAAMFALQRSPGAGTARASLSWGLRWITIGLTFAIVVHVTHGLDGAAMYVAAYLIECALGFDSLPVVALSMRTYRVGDDAQPRLLWWTLGLAIVARVIVLASAMYLARAFDDALYLFGGYLVYQGIRALHHDDESDHDRDGVVARWLRRVRAVRGPAVACLAAIAWTDLIYALDSVALLSVSSVSFIVVTASVLATLAMRSCYEIANSERVTARWPAARAVVAALLLLTGAKLLAHAYLDIPPLVMLVLVVVIICAGVAATTLAPRNPRNP